MKAEVVFADTNIILDWLGKREPFHPFAEAVFVLAELQKIELQISSLSMMTTEYVLRKQLGASNTRKALALIMTICCICPTGPREIALALASDMPDFEDAVQYQTALSHGAGVLLTRNLRDFGRASIPVMTAETYVKLQA